MLVSRFHVKWSEGTAKVGRETTATAWLKCFVDRTCRGILAGIVDVDKSAA